MRPTWRRTFANQTLGNNVVGTHRVPQPGSDMRIMRLRCPAYGTRRVPATLENVSYNPPAPRSHSLQPYAICAAVCATGGGDGVASDGVSVERAGGHFALHGDGAELCDGGQPLGGPPARCGESADRWPAFAGADSQWGTSRRVCSRVRGSFRSQHAAIFSQPFAALFRSAGPGVFRRLQFCQAVHGTLAFLAWHGA